jgi:hypothetical protein
MSRTFERANAVLHRVSLNVPGQYPLLELIEELANNPGGKCSVCGQQHPILVSVARAGKHDEGRYLQGRYSLPRICAFRKQRFRVFHNQHL